MHSVVVLALDRVVPFDLGIAERIFCAALDAQGQRLYSVTTCAIGGGSVATSADYRILVDLDERALAEADTVVIATQEPDGRLREFGELDPDVLDALSLMRSDVRLMSICTGSFILAAAGLLNGMSATTHWAHAANFARLFPQVDLRPGVLFVDNGRVLTSAGGAAGIDLCLHVVRRDHGAATANRAARVCVVPPWRDGGQAQFIEHAVPAIAESSTGPTREWAQCRLREPLTLEDLAENAAMSIRTFSRRFRSEVGTSPKKWLTQLRVDRARSLLESTDLPVEHIALESGFTSSSLLRQHLRVALGVSPQLYRRTFRGPAVGAGRP